MSCTYTSLERKTLVFEFLYTYLSTYFKPISQLERETCKTSLSFPALFSKNFTSSPKCLSI